MCECHLTPLITHPSRITSRTRFQSRKPKSEKSQELTWLAQPTPVVRIAAYVDRIVVGRAGRRSPQLDRTAYIRPPPYLAAQQMRIRHQIARHQHASGDAGASAFHRLDQHLQLIILQPFQHRISKQALVRHQATGAADRLLAVFVVLQRRFSFTPGFMVSTYPRLQQSLSQIVPLPTKHKHQTDDLAFGVHRIHLRMQRERKTIEN